MKQTSSRFTRPSFCVPLLIASVGVVFSSVGIGISSCDMEKDRLRELERMRVLSPESATSSTIGEKVLVEGIISGSETSGPNGFVAYEQRRVERVRRNASSPPRSGNTRSDYLSPGAGAGGNDYE